jgi:hypothetical protein
MRKSALRNVVWLIVITGGVGSAYEARASQTCSGSTPSSSGSSPVVSYCAVASYETSGPGVSLLAQDQGASVSNTFALEADTLHNSAIKATVGGGSGYAVYAKATTSGTGVYGIGLYGVYGDTAISTGTGVYGNSASNIGVYGNSSLGTGVYGVTNNSSSTGYGVYGTATSASAYGVVGTNGSTTGAGIGVFGYTLSSSSSSVGVRAVATSGNGVYASNSRTDMNAAVVSAASGDNTNGLAYWGGGNVEITGAYYVNSTCVAGCSSDQRLKKNIEPLTGALNHVLQLKGVTYEWKNPEEHGNQSGTQTGFIAQEVEKVFPDWVDQDSKGLKRIVLNPTQLAALEIESIRTLKAENDDLRERVKSLEAGRRPMISGVGEGGIGLGLLGVATALVLPRRKQLNVQAVR